MYFPIHSLGRVFFCKKECQYTASSWDELENTPSSDLEICLSRDFAPLVPRASANLSILGGRIFQYIPPLGSALLHYLLHSCELSVKKIIWDLYKEIIIVVSIFFVVLQKSLLCQFSALFYKNHCCVNFFRCSTKIIVVSIFFSIPDEQLHPLEKL